MFNDSINFSPDKTIGETLDIVATRVLPLLVEPVRFNYSYATAMIL
jgi:hypothetical protein